METHPSWDQSCGEFGTLPWPWGHRVLSCITVISQGDQLPAHWVLYCHYDVVSEGRRWCPETPWLLKQEQILVLLKLSLSWKEQSPPSNLEQLSRELPICLCLKNKSPCVLSGARHRSREEGRITHWHRRGDTKMIVNKTWGGGVPPGPVSEQRVMAGRSQDEQSTASLGYVCLDFLWGCQLLEGDTSIIESIIKLPWHWHPELIPSSHTCSQVSLWPAMPTFQHLGHYWWPGPRIKVTRLKRDWCTLVTVDTV